MNRICPPSVARYITVDKRLVDVIPKIGLHDCKTAIYDSIPKYYKNSHGYSCHNAKAKYLKLKMFFSNAAHLNAYVALLLLLILGGLVYRNIKKLPKLVK